MRHALDAWAAPDQAQERLRCAFLARLDEGPDAVRREGRPSHLTASAVVLDASHTSVLLVLHRKTGLWLQPGGHVEDGDTSLGAAAVVARDGARPSVSGESLDVAWYAVDALPVQRGVDLQPMVAAAVRP